MSSDNPEEEPYLIRGESRRAFGPPREMSLELRIEQIEFAHHSLRFICQSLKQLTFFAREEQTFDWAKTAHGTFDYLLKEYLFENLEGVDWTLYNYMDAIYEFTIFGDPHASIGFVGCCAHDFVYQLIRGVIHSIGHRVETDEELEATKSKREDFYQDWWRKTFEHYWSCHAKVFREMIPIDFDTVKAGMLNEYTKPGTFFCRWIVQVPKSPASKVHVLRWCKSRNDQDSR